MLNIMRKHARSWVIKILLGLVAVVFVIGFGMGGYGSGQDDRLVEVNGVYITSRQINDELGKLEEQAKQRFGPQYSQIAKFLNLKQRALSTLVDRVLMTQTAQSLGVVVTADELRAHVAAIPAFQVQGRFSEDIYRRVLARNRIKPADFEASQSTQLLFEKLSAMMIGAVQVTPMQVEQALMEQLTEVKGVYLVFEPEDFTKGLTAGNEDLAAYYQQHKKQYQVPAKVKLSSLTFSSVDYMDKVEVTEDDIAAIYQIQRKRYIKPEQVAAGHILIKVAADALPELAEAAKKKAEKIMAEAKEGKTGFEDLAKKHSEGPTGPKGGDLGTFGRGVMDEAFERMAFSLKAGELGLVRSRFGYHVVRVTEKKKAHTVPLSEVSGEIRKALEEERARRLAMAAAERAFEQVAKGRALAEVAGKLGTDVSLTDWMVMGQSISTLPGLEGVKGALAGMGIGQVARPLPYKLGAVLVAVAERKAARFKDLAEVKEEVRAKVLALKASEAARTGAVETLKKMTADAKPAAALEAMKGAVKTDWLARSAQIEGLAGSEMLVKQLFLRPADHPVMTGPLKVGEGYAAVVLAGRKQPEQAEMDAKREEVAAKVLSDQRQAFLQAFRSDLTERADIKILGKL